MVRGFHLSFGLQNQTGFHSWFGSHACSGFQNYSGSQFIVWYFVWCVI